MASTTALFTGLSGLTANARRLDSIGNNIANVNTVAYKSSRMLFAPTFSRNLSIGAMPGDVNGGANPQQIGLGTSIAGVQRNFSNGAISATGLAGDIAIEGDGFFIVRNGTEQFYTRAGAFQRNESNDLVTIAGANVQGFAVDDQFRIVEGDLVDLNIPIGTLTLAEASRNVVFNGNLSASGVVGTTGSVHESRAFYTDAGLTTLLGSPNFDLTVPGNDLYVDDGSGGTFFAIEGGAGTIITLSGIDKGGKELETLSFAFSAAPVEGVDAHGATLQDFMNFLDEALGLSDTTEEGQSLGGNVSFSNGQVIITGNEGTVQDLAIETADMVATSNGAGISQPFMWSKTGDADGESVRTSFTVYDSLGTPLTVDLTLVLQETTPGEGTTWEFLAESSDNALVDRVIGIGVVEFDANGRFISASNDAFSITRDNGAVTPLTVTMQFDSRSDSISALTDVGSRTGRRLSGRLAHRHARRFRDRRRRHHHRRVHQRPVAHARPGRARQVLQPPGSGGRW